LSTTLITPATASPPYCAAAPPRSTSIRSIMLAGIASRSTPVEPRPVVPFTFSSALVCRRRPFTSTSTWSGPMPRSVSGWITSLPSATPLRGAWMPGASDCSARLVCIRPVARSAVPGITSTGCGTSITERS